MKFKVTDRFDPDSKEARVLEKIFNSPELDQLFEEVQNDSRVQNAMSQVMFETFAYGAASHASNEKVGFEIDQAIKRRSIPLEVPARLSSEEKK